MIFNEDWYRYVFSYDLKGMQAVKDKYLGPNGYTFAECKISGRVDKIIYFSLNSILIAW